MQPRLQASRRPNILYEQASSACYCPALLQGIENKSLKLMPTLSFSVLAVGICSENHGAQAANSQTWPNTWKVMQELELAPLNMMGSLSKAR